MNILVNNVFAGGFGGKDANDGFKAFKKLQAGTFSQADFNLSM